MATQGNDGAALEVALADGSIQSDGIAELTGMIDKSDKKGHVKFTATDCDNWMDIPIEIIASWEIVGRQGCHDHSHSVVRMKLKRPEDSGAALYFDMMTNALAALSAEPPPAAAASRAIPTARFGPGDHQMIANRLIAQAGPIGPLGAKTRYCGQCTLSQSGGALGGARWTRYCCWADPGDPWRKMVADCENGMEEEACNPDWSNSSSYYK